MFLKLFAENSFQEKRKNAYRYYLCFSPFRMC